MSDRAAQHRAASPTPSAPTTRAIAGPAQSRLVDLSATLNAAPPVQRLASTRHANRTGMPDPLKAGIEAMSGMAMDHVRVHRNSARPAQLQAHAFAQGSDIHLAPGQAHHLPHEAWHVVQQAQGRVAPTMQLKSGTEINDDDGLEREADAMGARAVAYGGADRPAAAPSAAAPIATGQPAQCVRKWTKKRVDEYKKFLARRAQHRLNKGKNKPVNKLIRKLRNARLKADPNKEFRMAQAPLSGHHAPPLALSNKRGGPLAYGTRDSQIEKDKPRLYLSPNEDENRIAHGTMHAGEAMMGLNRQGRFGGTDDELVKRQILAHSGLHMGPGNTEITASSQSKTDREQDVPLPPMQPLSTVTPGLMLHHGANLGATNFQIDDDSTDSEPDNDFEDHPSDSDDTWELKSDDEEDGGEMSDEEDGEISDSDSSDDD